MITKGIIKRTPSSTLDKNNYKFDVRIPIFEEAGSNDEYISQCCLCYNDDSAYTYNVGDVVYLSFENNDLDKPIIIGKLFCSKNIENENKYPVNKPVEETDIKMLQDSISKIVSYLEHYQGGGGSSIEMDVDGKTLVITVNTPNESED